MSSKLIKQFYGNLENNLDSLKSLIQSHINQLYKQKPAFAEKYHIDNLQFLVSDSLSFYKEASNFFKEISPTNSLVVYEGARLTKDDTCNCNKCSHYLDNVATISFFVKLNGLQLGIHITLLYGDSASEPFDVETVLFESEAVTISKSKCCECCNKCDYNEDFKNQEPYSKVSKYAELYIDDLTKIRTFCLKMPNGTYITFDPLKHTDFLALKYNDFKDLIEKVNQLGLEGIRIDVKD